MPGCGSFWCCVPVVSAVVPGMQEEELGRVKGKDGCMLGTTGATATRAYKAELELNGRQRTACRWHAGAARWGGTLRRHLGALTQAGGVPDDREESLGD